MKTLIISVNRLGFPAYVLPIGAAYLFSYLRDKGQDTRFLDLCFTREEEIENELSRTISEFSPDLIGISIRNYCTFMDDPPVFFIPFVERVVRVCRSISAARIVLGGGGFSNDAAEILQRTGADFGIRGEGEKSLYDLIRTIEQGGSLQNISGLVYRNESGRWVYNSISFISDLDSIPYPARDCYDWRYFSSKSELDLYTTETILTTRGCPYKCIYCFNPNFYRHRFTTRSAVSVADEITLLISKGIRRIHFLDFAFNLPEGHALSILQEIRKRGLSFTWTGAIHPYPAESLPEELFEHMALTGCESLDFDTITGCKEIASRLKRPGFSKESISRSARLCHLYGIKFSHYLLIGGPGENRSSISETLELVEETEPSRKPGLVSNVGVVIGRNTELAEIALRDDAIDSETSYLFPPPIYLSPQFDRQAVEVIETYRRRHPDWLFVGIEFEHLLEHLGVKNYIDGVKIPSDKIRRSSPFPELILPDLDKRLVNCTPRKDQVTLFILDSRESEEQALPWIKWIKSEYSGTENVRPYFVSVIQDLRFFISRDMILSFVKRASQGINRLVDWDHKFADSLEIFERKKPWIVIVNTRGILYDILELKFFTPDNIQLVRNAVFNAQFSLHSEMV